MVYLVFCYWFLAQQSAPMALMIITGRLVNLADSRGFVGKSLRYKSVRLGLVIGSQLFLKK